MHQVNWLKNAVFYNIYPQSFFDYTNYTIAAVMMAIL